MAYQVIPLRYISTGYGYAVCANSILAVLPPETSPSKRRLSEARNTKRYVDMTGGHAVRSLLLTDTGQVIGCAVSPKTVLARLNANETQKTSEPE